MPLVKNKKTLNVRQEEFTQLQTGFLAGKKKKKKRSQDLKQTTKKNNRDMICMSKENELSSSITN